MSSRDEIFRPAYHPAGRDEELRFAMEELRVGRWLPVWKLLARTGTNWGLGGFGGEAAGDQRHRLESVRAASAEVLGTRSTNQCATCSYATDVPQITRDE